MQLASYSWGDPSKSSLLFLHGIRGHGQRYKKVALDHLASSFFVVALDLRGHGKSSYAPPWNLQTHLSDVLETTTALGIKSAAWIGQSFGGRLALEACAAVPDRVTSVVLLDPATQLTPERALEGADSERPDRRYASREDYVNELINSGFVKESSRPFIEEDARIHLNAVANGGFRVRYEQAAAVTAWGECAGPLRPLGPKPTLLVRGKDSGFVTAEQRNFLRLALGEMLTEVDVPGGHAVLWDAYDETVKAMKEFWSRLPTMTECGSSAASET